MITHHSYLYSHSRSEDNSQKKSTLPYQQGDTIIVHLDPKTGNITYSKKGSTSPPFVQSTSIRSTSKEPVHFCALLYHAITDISLV